MRIYTKAGDGGETSLLSGGRVDKGNPRVEAYGCLDELSAVLGLLRTEETLPSDTERRLRGVQDVLLVVGGVVADSEGRLDHSPDAWDPCQLEQWIDAMESELEPLMNFILPGGTRPAALAHVARTVCRRAERRLVALVQDGENLPQGILAYLNRLSDALFVVGRFLNHLVGVADDRWESPASGKRS